jgi:flavin prenyltransferase
LVLGFRETPLSLLHLENLRRLARAGAVVLPPIPAFYVGAPVGAEPAEPETLDRFLDAYALRVLDQLGVATPELAGDLRWAE